LQQLAVPVFTIEEKEHPDAASGPLRGYLFSSGQAAVGGGGADGSLNQDGWDGQGYEGCGAEKCVF